MEERSDQSVEVWAKETGADQGYTYGWVGVGCQHKWEPKRLGTNEFDHAV